MFDRVHIHLTLPALIVLNACPAFSQTSGPVPGGDPYASAPSAVVAPVPGQQPGLAPAPGSVPANLPGGPTAGPSFAAPMGGPIPTQPPAAAPPTVVGPVHVPSAYQQLPTRANDAESRIAELRCLLPVSSAKELQDPIYQLCEWLDDMVAAHNKLANSFSRHESTKVQLEAERRAVEKFSHLKNDATLLKADLLIQQQRYPEALAPLIEIVSSEPRTATGQAAYRRLKDIGFAEEVGSAVKTLPAPAATPSPTSPAPSRPPVAAQTRRPLPVSAGKTVSSPRVVPAGKTVTAPRVTAKRLPPARPPKQQTYRIWSAQSGPLWLTGSPSGAPIKRTLAGRR